MPTPETIQEPLESKVLKHCKECHPCIASAADKGVGSSFYKFLNYNQSPQH